MEEVTGGWRRQHNEMLYNVCTSPNTIRLINSSIMRWAGHVADMEEIRNAYKILVGEPERKNHSEGIGVDGRIILEWISGKECEKV
jgi:hypothetical protein